MELRRVKILLIPNKEQEQFFYDSAYYSQMIYNIAIDQCRYNTSGKLFLSKYELMNIAGEVRREFEGFEKIPVYTLRTSVGNLHQAYMNMTHGMAGHPRYKHFERSRKSFGVCVSCDYFNKNTSLVLKEHSVKVPGLPDLVRAKHCHWLTSKKTDKELLWLKMYDAHIYHDNKYWFLSVAVETEITPEALTDEIIGVSIGINGIYTSNGTSELVINTQQIGVLERRKKILQQEIQRKYEQNKGIKSDSIKREERKLKKVERRLCNMRNSSIHKAVNDIVRQMPSLVMLEDKSRVKNCNLAKPVREQFYSIHRLLVEKAHNYTIEVGIVARTFPSREMCSTCGCIRNDLTQSDTVYKCDDCGLEIDIDYNTALNLKNCTEYKGV